MAGTGRSRDVGVVVGSLASQDEAGTLGLAPGAGHAMNS